MILVVLCGEDRPEGMGEIEALAEVRYATRDTLKSAIAGADALFLWDFFSPVVKDVWAHADSLKWIHVAAAGVDKLLFPGLAESDVVVTNSRGVFDRPIAEFVLASILAMAKDVAGSLRRQQSEIWEHRETQSIEGRDALVVGTGAIGREIARLLQAMGMNVSGVGRTGRLGDPDFGVVHSSNDLTSAVEDADYVVLVAPLTEQSRGMVNSEVLKSMKPTARLVNVGRGELVDESALVSALEAGEIAGAALDVFESEPLAGGSPLWAMENVLVSAHLSGDTVGWRQRLVALFAANVEKYLREEKLVNVVDKRLGFVA